jgi:hypothetical protein
MELRRSLILWPCGAALALAGCGSSRTFTPPCSPQATHVVAQQLALPAVRIADARSIGNDSMPQCSFTGRLPSGKRFVVTVNVDTSPQPYAVLSRTIVEGQQVFSPVRLVPAPISVMHLGLLASWFPNQLQLMSTDGVRLVRTTVVWPGAKQAEKIRFATRLSRLYLKTSKPGLAHGYPSGG